MVSQSNELTLRLSPSAEGLGAEISGTPGFNPRRGLAIARRAFPTKDDTLKSSVFRRD